MGTFERLEQNTLDYSGKEMLLLSLQYYDGEPVLQIEQEPHYWRKHRLFVTHRAFPEKTFSHTLDDYQFCWDIGWSIYLGITIPYFTNQLNLLSIQDYEQEKGIRFDAERPFPSEKRRKITHIPLPSDDKDTILHESNRLLHATGKKVLEILLSHENPKDWPYNNA
ncbi:MAG: hypothetical protein MRY79_04270 [Alphaproteobacteria bacterium]|nr:hypothetical protein [Alphaproteobacteria bacterium]